MKRCPKCGGQMYLESDGYENLPKCLQCGFIIYKKVSSNIQRIGVDRRA